MNNKKPYVKLALDAAMGITFALLFNKTVLGGMAFHEIAGAAIGFAILVHILLNATFVKKITLRLFDKTLPGKTRFSYLLNVLLLLSMIFVILSGLLISRVLLPNFRFGSENWFKISHMGVSFFTLILIGVHVGLHWHWVMKVTQRLLDLKLPKAVSRVLLTSAAAVVLVFGAYQVYATNYISKFGMLEAALGVSSAASAQGAMHRPQAGGGAPAPTATAAGERSGDGSASVSQAAAPPAKAQGRSQQSTSFLKVIATYFGIMALFGGITYYADQWIGRRKRTAAAKL
ncbi:DUF4405 domain-containing protein [Paenibacillus sp. S-38]|uniref:DUF4405 domain-containing protein n=1 Tax=Paenibacillus sp. S-38 TaxID=3416710 RepID=UPI003CFA0EB8